MNLPIKYEEKMKRLLKNEFEAYLGVYDRALKVGLRVNTSKITCEEFERIAPYEIERIPWIENGYYCKAEHGWSKHPYYFAGLYYLQEPSAMTPASRLEVNPYDRVLDLCAAPGGKATELGAKLKGRGMLVANDISNSRAKALLKNLELMGISNCYVTSEDPSKLVKAFPEFFDKILVDAPCSGEGMFHKEPSMMKFYEEHGPEYYSPIQRGLLVQACKMLKPGGRLLFSTCTFDDLEDEGSVSYLLNEEASLHQSEMKGFEGFSCGLPYEGVDKDKCVRIWPHKMEGEGHFLSLFEKDMESEDIACAKKKQVTKGIVFDKLPKEVKEFLAMCNYHWEEGSFKVLQDNVYYLGSSDYVPEKLRYLRTGLLLGECKKNRFEPSQAFAMALKREEFTQSVSLNVGDIRVVKYLKGETISLEEEQGKKGYCLICVENYPLGWGKLQNNTLKNKYYKGWRMQ